MMLRRQSASGSGSERTIARSASAKTWGWGVAVHEHKTAANKATAPVTGPIGGFALAHFGFIV
jgi:hypothetical protein